MSKRGFVSQKPIIKDKVEALLAHLLLLNRGDRISHETLQTIIGCPKATGIWQSVLTKSRRRLRDERGITLTAIPSVGYELTPVAEQIASAKRMRRAIRQLGKDVKEKQAIPSSEMSVHQQKIRAITAGNAYQAKLSVQRQLRSNRKALSTREVIPSVGAAKRAAQERSTRGT